MPAVSPERLQDRADAIVEAAGRVFAEHGFERASISDIARRAGISDGLVYRYFRNKRELLHGVLERFYQRILVDLETRVFAQASFCDRLGTLIHRHLETFVADADLCRLFISEVRTADDYAGSAIHDLNRRYTSVLVRVVREAVETGEVREGLDPRLFRDVLFGAIEHAAWRHIHGRSALDADQTARELTLILTRGVCARMD